MIYETICLVNGKTYVGKHKTEDLDDGYLGSGKLLSLSIKKHGRENFSRRILRYCSSEEEMNELESKLVTEEFCLRDDNYNLCTGGRGGWSYVNRVTSSEQKRNAGKLGAKYAFLSNKSTMIRRNLDPEWWKEVTNKKSASLKGKQSFLGRKHSEESKAKMRRSHFGLQVGEKNSQFGSMWITDGVTSLSIKKTDPIPKGYRRGRKIKFTDA